ncbi:hypothetical protein VTN31DRAFT_3598 [Thermomyces dupontii]|uniref:uncharacterized protein n=1 Tax=Talaromyces thermophilus TaxID=28565 RepID=UPI0037424BAB
MGFIRKESFSFVMWSSTNVRLPIFETDDHHSTTENSGSSSGGMPGNDRSSPLSEPPSEPMNPTVSDAQNTEELGYVWPSWYSVQRPSLLTSWMWWRIPSIHRWMCTSGIFLPLFHSFFFHCYNHSHVYASRFDYTGRRRRRLETASEPAGCPRRQVHGNFRGRIRIQVSPYIVHCKTAEPLRKKQKCSSDKLGLLVDSDRIRCTENKHGAIDGTQRAQSRIRS